MGNRPTTPAVSPAMSPKGLSTKWLVVSILLASLLGVLAIVAFEMLRTPPIDVVEKEAPATAVPSAKPDDKPVATPSIAPDPSESSHLVDDDGRTLWASPTTGPPLDLTYLPPGSQIIVALRPMELTNHAEGAKVLAALGSLGQRAIEYLNDATLSKFESIDRLLISCQATSAGEWQMALVAHFQTPLSADGLLAKLEAGTPKSHDGKKYWLAGERAYYLPDAGEGRVLVVATPALVADIIDLAGTAPPLRRDIERLLAHTDASRLLTVIVAPNFLFSEGQGMFSGEMARLRGPLFWFLGDVLSAAALSMNWDENFFVELAAMPTLDTPPPTAANQLAERVRQIPDAIEDYVLRLNPQPYGRRVVARFPQMIHKLAAYTRSGVENGTVVVLRSYLPAVAGHNLIMGAELTLAETPVLATAKKDGKQTVSNAETNAPTAANSVGEILARKTSLSFTRDSLEAALEQLSNDIGVEIVILGPDLQADGITRNQQLGIHLENQSAADILVEILRKANPDKTATSAADKRQKLVYVVKPKSPGAKEVIFVTTRARAAERGEKLPAAFQP